MPERVSALLLAALLPLLLLAGGAAAEPLAITPFYSVNQSPLAQIFGLPAAESALLQRPGRYWGLLGFDVANDFAHDSSRRDQILLDGESYRVTFALRYGVTERLELGADLPLVGYGGGVLDGMIEGWHDFFGLVQGGRTEAPHDRLLMSYRRDGEERLRLEHGNFGLGDLRLNGGWQLYGEGSAPDRALALRASIKLPTGSSSRLRGSGSTDLALWLTGSDGYLLPGSWGRLTLFAAGGLLALSEGRVLAGQQNNLVEFGSFGLGWAPADWIAFKAETALNSPFYRSSDLPELGEPAIRLLFGGTLGLAPRTALDIGVSEDVSVSTSPDFAIHLGLSHQF